MVVIHLQHHLASESSKSSKSSESSAVESDRSDRSDISDSSRDSHDSNIQISRNDIEIAISELMETYLAFYGCLISTFYSYVYPLDTSIRRKIKRTQESIGYFYRHVMNRKDEYSNYILEYMKNHGDIYLYAMYNKLYAIPESSMFSSNHEVYIVFASSNYGVTQTNYEISGIAGENDYTEPSLSIQINSDDLILSETSEKSEKSEKSERSSLNSFKEKFEKSLNKYCEKTSDFFHDTYYATSLIPDDMLTTLEDYCERFKAIVMMKYDEIFTKIQLFASTHEHFQLLFAVFKIIVSDETDKTDERTDENLKSENSELLFELYPKAEEPSSDDDSEEEDEEEDEEDLKSEDKDEN